MQINLDEKLNTRHLSVFQSTDFELVFYGGAGAGKSYTVADKLNLQPVLQKAQIKALIIRKSMPSLRKTCWELMQQRAAALGVPYEVNRAESIMHLPYGSKYFFLSINNNAEIEKIKSITDCDLIWFEEANELTEAAYDQALLRLRGGEGKFKQIILTFNPIGKTSWIYDRFFVRNVGNARKVRVTADDNPWAAPEYIRQLEALKDVNENLYRVYRLGEWGNLEGNIYTNYRIVESVPQKIDEAVWGVDFGYNNQTAVVRAMLHDGEVYVEEKVYRTHLTNQDLIDILKELGAGHDTIYCDSAEPQRIDELRRAGFYAREAHKSVRDGIDFVQRLRLHILAGSENLLKELQSYTWSRDKDGRWLDKPVKFRDHLMDAMRYCLYTHLRKQQSLEPSTFTVSDLGL